MVFASPPVLSTATYIRLVLVVRVQEVVPAARFAVETELEPSDGGGGGEGEGGGGEGGGFREPQSMQSVPRPQSEYSAPGPPSSHAESDAYMHVFLQPPCALVMLTIMRAKMMWASRGAGPGVLESNDSSDMVKPCAGRVPRQAVLWMSVDVGSMIPTQPRADGATSTRSAHLKLYLCIHTCATSFKSCTR